MLPRVAQPGTLRRMPGMSNLQAAGVPLIDGRVSGALPPQDLQVLGAPPGERFDVQGGGVAPPAQNRASEDYPDDSRNAPPNLSLIPTSCYLPPPAGKNGLRQIKYAHFSSSGRVKQIPGGQRYPSPPPPSPDLRSGGPDRLVARDLPDIQGEISVSVNRKMNIIF